MVNKLCINLGDFILVEQLGIFYIEVLIPNFYPNSHFDVSKTFILSCSDQQQMGNLPYFKQLAEDIRKDWRKYADREVHNIIAQD